MQAAGGAPVIGEHEGATDRPAGRPGAWRMFATVATIGYVIDVTTKVIAVERLSGRADVQVLGEILQLHLTRNPGAAFSAGTQYTVVISCIAIVAVLVIAWYSRRVGSLLWAVALGLLLAGVAGNLTDRLLREPGPMRGHVIDFLMLPHWPVFNVADVCINLGAALILVQAFRGVRLDGGRHAREAGPQESTG